MTESDYQLLERHKINLLFLKHLRCFKKVNDLNISKMKQYSNQLFVLQHLYSEYIDNVSKISKAFESQKIPYAVLKGFSIANDLYSFDNLIFREFVDIDILINNEDVAKVTRLLKENSFIQGKIRNDEIIPVQRSEIIYWSLNSHQLSEFVKNSKYSSISPKYWLEFDINTTIFEGGQKQDPIPNSIILSHTQRLLPNKDSYRVLSPTYNLLQLCYHFYKDTVYELKKESRNDYRLSKFCDIREFIIHFRKKIDWPEFIKLVNESNIGEQIYYVLWLVSSFYGDLRIEDILKAINRTRTYEIDKINWEGMLL